MEPRAAVARVAVDGDDAALARRTADATCRTDPATGETCAWYHGLWQDLRAIGLGSGIAHHPRFFADALAIVAEATRAPRVLVAGAADAAIAAAVFAASDALGLAPHVTVLDRCDTPLALNTAFAARAGRPIATIRADVFEHAPREAYDAIFAHSFVGYFAPRTRRALVAQWASMLRPSGSLAIVNRLRAGDPDTPVTFDARGAAAFCAAVEERLRATLAPAELATQTARAAAYVRNHRVHPLPEGELEAAFDAAGLRVAYGDVATADDPRGRGVGGGVAVASNARYACLVARAAPAVSPVKGTA